MSGKAVAQDLINEGFRVDQFGAPAGFESDFLPDVLLAAELWARDALGDTAYDSAAKDAATVALKLAFQQLRTAEVAHASAALWRRRALAVDSNAVAGQTGLEYLNRREYLEHATAAEARARESLGYAATRLGITLDDNTPGSAIAVGHVETGRFPAASSTAVTA